MQLNHIGIINRSEEEALRFYQDFLGLEKIKEIRLSPELSEQLFALYQEIKVLVFEKAGLKIEVFIADFQLGHPNFTHFGIIVKDIPVIAEKAKRSDVEVIIGKHKEKIVYFLKDFSGNLIEIKQTA